MSKKAGLLLLLILVAVFAIWKFRTRAYPIINEKPRGSTIVAFGDSLTAGTGSTEGHDYPTMLGKMLNVEILNRGVPGDTTESALARLERDVLVEDPRIVIVCLGGNDSLQSLSAEKMYSNLRRIIDVIQARGALVILAGVRSASLTDQFEKPLRSLAREKGCVFVPNVLRGILDDPGKRSDPIHPNDEGYRIIAERMSETLRPYL